MIKQLDTRALLNAFFRHGRLFTFILGPILVGGVLYILFATPAYESTAKLLVKFGREARPEIASQNASENDTADEHHEQVQSDVKILTSRDIGETLLNDMTIGQVYPSIARHPPSNGTVMDAALKRLDGDLKVKTENDSDLISIGLYNRKPDVAAAELKNLIDIFITRQSQIYSNPQTAVLHEQAADAYRELQAADKNLHDYMAQAGISSVDEELRLLLQQRGDIAGYMARRPSGGENVKGGTESVAYHVNGAKAVPATFGVIPAQIPTDGNDRFPMLDDVQRKIDDLRAHEVELLQTYQPDSEVVSNVRRDINAQIAAQNASAGALSNQIADLDRQIADKQQRKVHYEELLRNDQMSEEVYKAAETRAQAAEADDDLNSRKITQIAVIEQPTTPYKPARPQKAIILGLCLLIGTAFGLGAVIAAENINYSFALPEEAAEELGVPVIASFAAYRSPQGASLSNFNHGRV